jgi:hypothetical protein
VAKPVRVRRLTDQGAETLCCLEALLDAPPGVSHPHQFGQWGSVVCRRCRWPGRSRVSRCGSCATARTGSQRRTRWVFAPPDLRVAQ